jgi:SAM-dependent methyltransferase
MVEGLHDCIHAPLSAQAKNGTRPAMNGKDIFDRKARRLRRDRIASAAKEDRWLIDRMAGELLDRWECEDISAKRVLILGFDNNIIQIGLEAENMLCFRADPGFRLTSVSRGIQCDEDYLPFADGSFDAIFWVGSLDTVNDVPGALILTRRALKPGGLFLGSFLGAGSLTALRDCVSASAGDPMIARLHPQIDVRAAGDLLTRAGFARPVADADSVAATYPSLPRLVADLRANGFGNVLAQRFPVRRSEYRAWCNRFEAGRGDNGKVTEHFETIQMTGYGPIGAAAK